MVKIHCKNCGKEFEVKPYREKTAKYCSRRCKSIDVYKGMKEKGYGLTLSDGSHSIGNTYRKGLKPSNAFKHGHIPWNKGVEGLHLSPETEFANGCVPVNKMNVGTITQRKEKCGIQRNFIKVSEPNLWMPYAKFLWEKAYGKVKKGYVIHHINKNALDDRLENFMMLTRAEHLEIHRDDYINSKNSRIIYDTAIFYIAGD